MLQSSAGLVQGEVKSFIEQGVSLVSCILHALRAVIPFYVSAVLLTRHPPSMKHAFCVVCAYARYLTSRSCLCMAWFLACPLVRTTKAEQHEVLLHYNTVTA